MRQKHIEKIIAKYQINFEQDSLFDALSTDVLFNHFLKFKQAIYFQQFALRNDAKEMVQTFLDSKRFEEFKTLRYDAICIALNQFEKWNLQIDNLDLFKMMIQNNDYRVKVFLFDKLSHLQQMPEDTTQSAIKLLFHFKENVAINLDLSVNLDFILKHIEEKGMGIAFQSHILLTPEILKCLKEEKIEFKALDNKDFSTHVNEWFFQVLPSIQKGNFQKLEKLIYSLKEIPLEHLESAIMLSTHHTLTQFQHHEKHHELHAILEQLQLDKHINLSTHITHKRKI